MTVGGDATLDGVLGVALSGDFTPAAGQQFQVLTATRLVNEGLTLTGTAASQFDLVVTGTSVLLQATGGLAGDYNAGGSVDAAGYTVWRDGRGTTFTQSDYNVWADNYGATLGAEASTLPAYYWFWRLP